MAVRPLTLKQKRFVAEYLVDHNATRAAIRSGYSKKNAAQLGWQLLQIPTVHGEIQKRLAVIMARGTATREKVLFEWSNLGSSDPGQLLWQTGELDSKGQPTTPGSMKPLEEMPADFRRCIKSIKKTPEGAVEITFWDKNAPLTNLGKFHKLIGSELNVNVNVSLADKLAAARKRIGQ